MFVQVDQPTVRTCWTYFFYSGSGSQTLVLPWKMPEEKMRVAHFLMLSKSKTEVPAIRAFSSKCSSYNFLFSPFFSKISATSNLFLRFWGWLKGKAKVLCPCQNFQRINFRCRNEKKKVQYVSKKFPLPPFVMCTQRFFVQFDDGRKITFIWFSGDVEILKDAKSYRIGIKIVYFPRATRKYLAG